MVNFEKVGNVAVISFANDNKLNVGVTQKIKAEIIALIPPNTNVILNLEGIIYIDSTGFGMLLSVLRHCKNNRSGLKLCNIGSEAMELIELIQLQNIFDIRESVDDCIKSF